MFPLEVVLACPLKTQDLKQACSTAVCNEGDYLLDYRGFPVTAQFSLVKAV